MKRIFLIAIVLLCAIITTFIWYWRMPFNSQTVISWYIPLPEHFDLEKERSFYPIPPEKIRSHIKTIKITHIFSHDTNKRHKNIFFYDKNGHLLERSFYIADGTPKTRWNFEYDIRGNRISDNTNSHLDAVYNYDEKCNRIGWENYDLEGKKTSWAVLNYDNKQRLTEETCYNTSGHYEMYIYCYDLKGKLLQRLCYESSLSKRDIYLYDNKGNKLECIEWYETSGAGKRESCSYDEMGRLVEIRYYSGEDLRKRTTYQYDEKGNMIEEQRLGPRFDSSIYEINYRYNEKGLLLEKLSCIIFKEPQTGKKQISDTLQSVFEYEFYLE